MTKEKKDVVEKVVKVDTYKVIEEHTEDVEEVDEKWLDKTKGFIAKAAPKVGFFVGGFAVGVLTMAIKYSNGDNVVEDAIEFIEVAEELGE